MKKLMLLVIVIYSFISCNVLEEKEKFVDDNLENSYWRFYAVNSNPYNFSHETLCNGIVVKFNTGQTMQLLNYSQSLNDESKWISIHDTLNTLTIDITQKTFVIEKIKKIDKTKYVGIGNLYNISSTTNSSTGITTKKRTLDYNFEAVGERLTKEEAESFINKKYARPAEVLSETKWKLIINAPYDPNTTWQKGNGLKDTILNLEFKSYHSIKLPDYYYASTSDTTSWTKTGIVIETVNGNWWYQTSDSTVQFNLGLNSLNPNQSFRFTGIFKNGIMKGIAGRYQEMYSIEYNFSGIKK
ncbi:MAG TPA: hypothetical protein VK152_00295 [Paludibacter sp.]|nr:hypothetical protein [Paludibacter sp.]